MHAAAAWGWHRLDDGWARRIVAAAGIRAGDLVLDIGAGKGALTTHLVAAGARVLAVELHPGRAAHLRHRFAAHDVTVLQIDAGRSLLLPRRPFKVVANPPYGISSALVRCLTAPGSRLVRADLVLQRAFVRKMAESVPSRRFQLSEGLRLPRRAFVPPPRVDSAILSIRDLTTTTPRPS